MIISRLGANISQLGINIFRVSVFLPQPEFQEAVQSAVEAAIAPLRDSVMSLVESHVEQLRLSQTKGFRSCMAQIV